MDKYILSLAIFSINVIVSSCHLTETSFDPIHPGMRKFDSLSFSDHKAFRYTSPPSMEMDIPMIVWWTGRLFIGKDVHLLNCPNSICYATADRKYKDDPRTYGFYIYGTDFDPEDTPLPRKPHHEWALYHEESPMNNYILVHNAMLKLFNHTSTFRRESDYPITTNSLDSVDYLTSRKPVPIDIKNNARKEGLAPVLFIQSHCDVASDRERYVSELMKYIPVDSVGSCLHNKDLPTSLQNPVETMFSGNLYDIISKYKFHVAYENALCNDYMTEKLFRPLHVGSIPVYRGSPKARDWMPNNKSIIMIDDFSSPKELAEFLLNLDQNDKEYDSYLTFKTDGISNNFLLKHMAEREWGNNEHGKPNSLTAFECYVCDKLNERYDIEKMHRVNPEIPLLPRRMANTKHMNCPQPHPSFGDISDISGNDSWRQAYWIEDYWSSLEKALAIGDMLENNEKHPKSFQKYWEKRMGPMPH